MYTLFKLYLRGHERDRKKKGDWSLSYSHLLLKMEPSAVKFQCQTLAVNPNEQINSVSSGVSLLELLLSA